MLLKILKWTGIVLVALFVIAEIIRLPFRLREEHTAEQVVKIHNTKLQLSDVMGDNLPPDPGADADKTIAGVDANQNGVRDDVELAVFKEYPNSAKTRAALLQYALTLQLQTLLPIVNEGTVTAVIREQSRSYECLSTIPFRKDENEKIMEKYFTDLDLLQAFIKDRQTNTPERIEYREKFVTKLGSFSESENELCDIDYSTLPN